MAAANIGRLREPKHVIYITENQTEDVSISQGTCAYTLLKECGLMWPRLLPNVVLRRNSTGCMFVTWAATLRFCSMLPCRFECSRAQLYQKAGVEILRSSCCIYRIMCNHNYTCMCYNNNKQTRRFGKGVDLLAFVCLFLFFVYFIFIFLCWRPQQCFPHMNLFVEVCHNISIGHHMVLGVRVLFSNLEELPD